MGEFEVNWGQVAFGGYSGYGCNKAAPDDKPEAKAETSAADEALQVVSKILENPTEKCDRQFASSERTNLEYYDCLVRRNLEIHENFKRLVLMKSLERADNALKQVDQEADGSLWGDIKLFLFEEATRVNFQASNAVLIDAARKSLDLYQATQQPEYLKKAASYLEVAALNVDTKVGFDIYRSPLEPTIWPVDGYFDIKLTQLAILQLTDPIDAYKFAEDVLAELRDQRVLQAQRSNVEAAEGYIKRVEMMQAELAFSQEKTDADKAIGEIDTCQLWFASQQGKRLLRLTSLGMYLKDLRFDELRSQNMIGSIRIKQAILQDDGNFTDAIKVFKEMLKQPETTQKYGGFIDLGLYAFFSLLHIALLTSATKAEAAKKLDEYIEGFDNLSPDMREALGLEVRQIGWCYRFSHASYLDCTDGFNVLGNWAQYLGHPTWAPADWAEVKNPIPWENFSLTTKLDFVVAALELISLKPDLKEEIRLQWTLLGQ